MELNKRECQNFMTQIQLLEKRNIDLESEVQFLREFREQTMKTQYKFEKT